MARALGIMAQACGWLFVVAAFTCLLVGLVLVFAAPAVRVRDEGYGPAAAALFFAPLVLVPSAIALVNGGALLRRRRIGQGVCVRCGYDLRGGGHRCPECGAQI